MNEEIQETNQGGRPQVVKYVSITGPIGTYIEHVDKLYLSGNVDNTPKHQIPTPEQMCKIVEKMMEDGLWYAGRAWAVVYRLYQIWGYQGNHRDFVKEVANWPFKRHQPTDCNEDAIGKPLRSGKYLDSPSTWLAKGAPYDAVKLGLAIEAELNKILPLF